MRLPPSDRPWIQRLRGTGRRPVTIGAGILLYARPFANALTALLLLPTFLLACTGDERRSAESPSPATSETVASPRGPSSAATPTATPSGPHWQQLAGSPTERHFGTATLLNDGRVLIAGGDLEQDVPGLAEIFDPHTDRTTSTGPMAQPRQTHTATLLADGRVLIVGGVGADPQDSYVAESEVYDPASGRFTQAGNLNERRVLHAAVRLADGRVLIAAGQSPPPRGLSRSLEVFDPATGTFTPAGTLPPGVQGEASGVLLDDGRVLIAANGRAALFDPRIGLAVDAASDLTARGFEDASVTWPWVATRLANGSVLLTGGCCDVKRWTDPQAGPTLAVAAVYDPRNHSLTAMPPMQTPRFRHTATLLQDGRVLVAGGITVAGHGAYEATAAAEIFEPATGTFTSAPAMLELRAHHSAVALLDGRVLLVGSHNYRRPSTAELFVR